MLEVKEVLSRIREREPKPGVVVLGDRIEDYWWFVSPSRISVESGNELSVFEEDVQSTITCFGGAASASASLSSFFPSPSFHRSPCSTAVRIADVDTGQILFRMDRTRAATPYDPVALGEDCALLSDYGRGFFSLGNLPEIARPFKKVIFSPDHFTCMRMTQDEIEALKDCVWVTNEEEAEILRNRCLHPDSVIVTHGSKAVHLTKDSYFVGTFPIDPVAAPHYCGIGDVFAASLSAAYFCDVPLEDAIPFAIACCRVVLQSGRRGTHRLLSEDLDKL